MTETSSKSLWLYAVFHMNLAFSSIPEAHYPIILDRCYWPLLEIATRMQIPFAFEATGYTLEVLESLDASFIEALKSAWHANQIEFIGASYTQSIFPLIPAQVNRQNLVEGQAVYDSLLGRRPTTAYVNEQTYSGGLIELYKEAGFETLFMEWNNPARFNHYPPALHYQPQRIISPDGSYSMNLVWNDSIAFQKLQRYLAENLNADEYLAYLDRHRSADQSRGFCFYGSDAEIFDYHPGALEAEYVATGAGTAVQRLVDLLETLQADTCIGWLTPSQWVAQFPPQGQAIQLESPEYPLPCKKQPKYNPTRWAVTGREDTQLNTRCYNRFYSMQALESLQKKPLDRSLWRKLLEKWGSDFRTYTTQEKTTLLRETAGSLDASLADQWKSQLKNDPDAMTFWNADTQAFNGPLSFEMQFKPHRLFGYPVLKNAEAVQALQIEGLEYYHDGSVRWLKAVMMVNIPQRSAVTLQWESGEKPPSLPEQLTLNQNNQRVTVETDSIKLALLTQKGGAVEALQFKQLDNRPWVGTLPHGHFEDIALGADFYSGHFILASKAGEKATDLQSVQLKLPDADCEYPIRIPMQMGVTTAIGKLWKTFYIYRHLPRIDLVYHFRFQDISAASCRVGMMTILPDAFNRDSLAYTTVNGGNVVERFPLAGHRVTHGDPVSVTVSSQHGVGATTGWVGVEDSQNRVILKTYPHEAYAMPLIDYQESEPDYFLRISPSIGEFDETSHNVWRGHHQVMFSWLGQKASDKPFNQLPLMSLSPHVKILPL